MAEDEKEELLYDGCGNSQGSTMEDWSALKGENPLWKNFLRCALVPSTGGAACGMGLGNIGGVVASRGFKDAYRNPSDSMIEALVSAMPLGAICGSVFVGYLMDRFGRRSSSMLVAVLIMISSLLLFIPLWVFLPWWAIFLCRFFVGIGTGMGYGTIYTMGAEMAHPSYRGRILTLVQVFTTVGIFLGYLTNLIALTSSQSAWCMSLGVQGLVAIPFFLVAYFGPESPRWLMMQGYRNLAVRTLCFLRTPQDDVREELQAMSAAAAATADARTAAWQHRRSSCNGRLPVIKEDQRRGGSIGTASSVAAGQKSSDSSGGWKDLCARSHRKMAAVGIILWGLQLLSGIDVITNYAPQIFDRGQDDISESRKLFYTLLVGVVYVAATPFATLTVDRLGRRALLLSGSFGMTLMYIGISVVIGGSIGGSEALLPFVLLLVIFYSVSWGPVSCAMASELVETSIRAKVNAVGTVTNWLADYVVVSSFLTLSSTLGERATFAMYASICFLSGIFVLVYVPETNGLALGDVRGSVESENG